MNSSLSKAAMEHFQFQKIDFNVVNEKGIQMFRNRPAYTLSTIDFDKAKLAVNANANCSFKEVTYSKVKIRVADILPSQKQIIITKVLSILFENYLGENLPQSLPLIISEDNFLVDGHHRWAARCLADPNHIVEVYKVNLDRDHLISALNIITTGYLELEGQSARGNIKNLNRKFIQEILTNALNGNSKRLPATVVNSKMKYFNIENVESITTDVPRQALLRFDMPVIDSEKAIEVLELLKSGKIDFTVF